MFVSVLKAAVNRSERSDPHALERDANLLAATDEELKHAFLHCIQAGLASAAVRFPEAGGLVEATIAKVLGNPQHEAAVFAKATQRKVSLDVPEGLAVPA